MSVFDRRFGIRLPSAQTGQPPARADYRYWPAAGGASELYRPPEDLVFDEDLYVQVLVGAPANAEAEFRWTGTQVEHCNFSNGACTWSPVTPGTGRTPVASDFVDLPSAPQTVGASNWPVKYLLWWEFDPEDLVRTVWAHWTDQGGTIELTEGGVQQAAEGLVTVHWTPELIRVLTTVDLNNVRLTDHLGRTYSARSVREIGRRRHIEITVRRVDP